MATDFYPNRPGVRLIYEPMDLTQQVSTDTATRSVLVLGVAKDGPTNSAIRLRTPDAINTTFGGVSRDDTTLFKERSVALAAKELWNSGCNDITIVRVNGISSQMTLNGSDGYPRIVLKSMYSGAKYNSNRVTVTPGTRTISITDHAGVVTHITYLATDDIGQVIDRINTAQSSTGVGAEMHDDADYREVGVTLAAVNNVAMTGGSDQLTMTDAEYSDALTAAYRLCEFAEGRYAYPVGAFLKLSGLTVSGINMNGVDDVHYLQNLAQFCAISTLNGFPRFGFIAYEPLRSVTISKIAARVAAIKTVDPVAYLMNDYIPAATDIDYDNLPVDTTLTYFAVLDNGEPTELGRYMAGYVAGPEHEVTDATLGVYNNTGIARTIARKSLGAPFINITNKPLVYNTGRITSTVKLRYTYTARQIDDLVGRNCLVFDRDSSGVVKVVDGIMATDSYWSRMGTVDMFNTIGDEIRMVCEPFYGDKADEGNLTILRQNIEKMLSKYQVAGALDNLGIRILAPNDNINHEIMIYVEASVPQEIRKIQVTVKPLRPRAVSV